MNKITAVILDWAGTTVDFGSLAPVRTIQSVFGDLGIKISDEEARRDMGLAKLDHLRAIVNRLKLPVNTDEVYERFIPRQMDLLVEHSGVIPGVVSAVETMRSRGWKIGSTTGYTRAMLDLVVAKAREQGYSPDCSLTPEEAGGGRPHPYMIYEAAKRLQRYPLWTFAKIGDTPADMEEGRNAGCWAVGVSATGNSKREDLLAAGAHAVIDSVANAIPTLEEIEQRLAAGERP